MRHERTLVFVVPEFAQQELPHLAVETLDAGHGVNMEEHEEFNKSTGKVNQAVCR